MISLIWELTADACAGDMRVDDFPFGLSPFGYAPHLGAQLSFFGVGATAAT